MGKKVVTLGEIMLRLSTPGNTRFVQSDSFDVVYGGGEANVAVSCANYGHDAYFVTKLPKHEIGQSKQMQRILISMLSWKVQTGSTGRVSLLLFRTRLPS